MPKRSSQSKSKTANASIAPIVLKLASSVAAHLSQLRNCAAAFLLCLNQAILKLLALHRPKHAMQAIGNITLTTLVSVEQLVRLSIMEPSS